MKTVDLFNWMTKRKVKLQPVIDKTGVLHWVAGFVILGRDGWQNIVVTQAEGKTPEEALQNLRTRHYTLHNGKCLR